MNWVIVVLNLIFKILQNEVEISNFSLGYLMIICMRIFDEVAAKHNAKLEIAKKLRNRGIRIAISCLMLFLAACGGDGGNSVRASSSSRIDWSWDVPKEVYLNPEIEYDTIVDSRDGKVYRIVKIEKQTWMAENLNFDPGQGGSGDAKYDWSWCYNNEPKNCDLAGRLYTWAAAMDSVTTGCGYESMYSPTQPVRGICPSGWHLPSEDEWNQLFMAVNVFDYKGKSLMSRAVWFEDDNRADAFGFSALPAGYGAKYSICQFYGDGFVTFFWSISEFNRNYVRNVGLHNGFMYDWMDEFSKDNAAYIRCVKNMSSDEMLEMSSRSLRHLDFSKCPKSVEEALDTLWRYYWCVPKKDFLNPEIEYDTIIDPRDSKVYKTVKIGDQIWMAENLNFDPGAIIVSGAKRYLWSWCFENVPESCDVTGRFYTWAAAIDSVKLHMDKSVDCGLDKTCALPDTVYGICPPGWHLPDTTEWGTLFRVAGGFEYAGAALKSHIGWSDNGNGTDSFGFSAWPSGYREGDHFHMFESGQGFAGFWSATESSEYGAYGVRLRYDSVSVEWSENSKIGAYSVRCVKN